MLDMGFEPEIKKILLDIRPDRQTLMTRWAMKWVSHFIRYVLRHTYSLKGLVMNFHTLDMYWDILTKRPCHEFFLQKWVLANQRLGTTFSSRDKHSLSNQRLQTMLLHCSGFPFTSVVSQQLLMSFIHSMRRFVWMKLLLDQRKFLLYQEREKNQFSNFNTSV